MRKSYEVRTSRRLISRQLANTAQEAVIEYLKSIGCRDDELMRVSVDAVAWRGAVYKAVPASCD
jgi:hypothetical protein